MSQKLLVILDSGTAPQRDAITAFIHGQGWDSWHWIDDVWLLNDVPNDVTPRELWLELIGSDYVLIPIRGLVMMLGTEMSFWGGHTRESWAWLIEKWGRADFPKPQPGPG
jgi:hypothetical protein